MVREPFFDSEINLLKFKTEIHILLNTYMNYVLEQTQHQLYSLNVNMLTVLIMISI